MAVVLTLACGTGAGVWALTRGGTDDGRGGRAQSSLAVASGAGEGTEKGSTAAGGSPSALPGGQAGTGDGPPTSEEPTTTVAEPAPGYSRSSDPVGYTVDVPEGWLRTERPRDGLPTVVEYAAPDGSGRLTLFEVSEKTPAISLDRAENDEGGYAEYRGYQDLGRTAGDGWAELSFSYDTDRGTRRVVDHRFTAADLKLYGIVASSLEGADVADGLLATALRSFCPPDADCG